MRLRRTSRCEYEKRRKDVVYSRGLCYNESPNEHGAYAMIDSYDENAVHRNKHSRRQPWAAYAADGSPVQLFETESQALWWVRTHLGGDVKQLGAEGFLKVEADG